MLTRKKIIVTGGAGFIGSEVVRQLTRRGNKVFVVDNLVNGTEENLAGIPEDMMELVISDIREIDKMRVLMKESSMIFHMACLGVRHSIHDPYENQDVNATGTFNLLMAAKEKEISRFVYVSSSEVYGTAKNVPMTEDHPTFPMTVYGSGKLAGECFTRAFYRTYGYPTVVIRPFNTYGERCHHEGDSGEVIPKFILRAMAGKEMVIFGDGTQTRDFTYVGDTARGIIDIGESPRTLGETINLGSGMEINMNVLAETVKKVVGNPNVCIKHIKQRPGDVLRLFADTQKAEDIIGFKTTVDFEEGLRKVKKWYEEKHESYEELLKDESIINWDIKNKGQSC